MCGEWFGFRWFGILFRFGVRCSFGYTDVLIACGMRNIGLACGFALVVLFWWRVLVGFGRLVWF